MINQDDIVAMAPDTRRLDLNRKDWKDHLQKVVRFSDTGTRIVYWDGPTDVNPAGKRKDVFEAMRAYSDAGKVRLFQRRCGEGMYLYEAEVR